APPPLHTLSLHDALPISVKADSPQVLALYHRRLHAKLRCPDSGHIAARTSADDNQVKAALRHDGLPSQVSKKHRDRIFDQLLERSEEHTSELQSRENLVC